MSKHKANGGGKWYHGEYKPSNPDKYNGDITDIIYRSKWEYKFCYYCDNEDRIKKWISEPPQHKIQYDVMEYGKYKQKTYNPDFWIQVERLDGEMDELIIEVKPYKQSIEPVEPKTSTVKSLRNYEYALRQYIKNINKWDAADAYCKKRAMTFYVLTEKYFDERQIKLF